MGDSVPVVTVFHYTANSFPLFYICHQNMTRGHINTVTGDTLIADWEYTQLHRRIQGKNISIHWVVPLYHLYLLKMSHSLIVLVFTILCFSLDGKPYGERLQNECGRDKRHSLPWWSHLEWTWTILKAPGGSDFFAGDAQGVGVKDWTDADEQGAWLGVAF